MPSTVVKLTLTVCLLGFDRSTLNTKFVVPLFPSAWLTSLIVIEGSGSSSSITSTAWLGKQPRSLRDRLTCCGAVVPAASLTLGDAADSRLNVAGLPLDLLHRVFGHARDFFLQLFPDCGANSSATTAPVKNFQFCKTESATRFRQADSSARDFGRHG